MGMKICDLVYGMHHILPAFPGKAVDNMYANVYSLFCQLAISFLEIGVGMTSVDQLQRFVVCRLKPKLYGEIGLFRQLGKHINGFVRLTVGAGGYAESHGIG